MNKPLATGKWRDKMGFNKILEKVDKISVLTNRDKDSVMVMSRALESYLILYGVEGLVYKYGCRRKF